MRTPKRFSAAPLWLAFSLALLPAIAGASAGAQQTGALERGYRTGYSDGYQAGWRDSLDRAARDHRSKDDYRRADRAYVEAYGAIEDYRDGYQQGFESGYDAGYSRRGFDSTVPAGITRRGTDTQPTGAANDTVNDQTGVDDRSPVTRTSTVIPGETVMRVELLGRLSTDVSQRGDPFEARVLEPSEYEGATVSGRVTRVRRPGKVKGAAELQLSFEQIRMPDGRSSNMSALVTEVVQAGDSEGVGDVDPEGGVRGRSSTKDDIAKVGAGAGLGAIIGAIAGGGKGAVIGAVIGGGASTGGVLTQRGKDIRLERGQQLLIRTSNDTRLQ